METGRRFSISTRIDLLLEEQPSASGAIDLTIDGTTRQSGDLSQIIWSGAEIVSCLSTCFALAPGDLIFTGTASGVGQIWTGETVRGTILDIPPVETQFRP